LRLNTNAQDVEETLLIHFKEIAQNLISALTIQPRMLNP
jgi:hypothetical protein